MRVVMLPEVVDYIIELSQILYEKNYFSYLEMSEEFAGELFEDIKTTLPDRLKRYLMNTAVIFL
jgi:hypothetical protein